MEVDGSSPSASTAQLDAARPLAGRFVLGTAAVLAELMALADAVDEEDGGFTVTAATWEGRDLELTLTARLPDRPREDGKRFRVLCREPRGYRVLAAEESSGPHLADDHVLLWPFVRPRAELYFYFDGADADPAALLGGLAAAHHAAVGDWFPLDRFLHFHGDRLAVLRHGYGMLAAGPDTLLAAFAAVLDAHGVRHSSPPPRPPRRWTDGGWRDETEPLRALLLGDGWVIAPAFEAAALD